MQACASVDPASVRLHASGIVPPPLRLRASLLRTPGSRDRSAPPGRDRPAEVESPEWVNAMPIVFRAIMPHGDELLPYTAADAGLAVLHQSMAAIGEALGKAKPDLVVIASPHHLRIPGHLAIADTSYAEGSVAAGDEVFSRRVTLDREFNRTLAEASAAAGLPPARAGFTTAEGPLASLPLDFGSLVPLYYLVGREGGPNVCIIGPPRDLGLRPLVRLGAEIARRSGGRRVAFVASADLAHAHRVDGPYGFDPAAADYDALVQKAALLGDLRPLVEVPPALVAKAKPDAPWQLAILQGLMDTPGRPFDLAYARPTYFGMLAARLEAS